MFKEVKNKRLYLQIVNQVQDLIAKGNLKAGDKLPPERELTEKFDVSRASIREAMSAIDKFFYLFAKTIDEALDLPYVYV